MPDEPLVFGQELPKPKGDTRKQMPLRMDPALFDKLEIMAKSSSKSINQLICETLDDRTTVTPGKVHLDDVRRVIRQAFDAQVNAYGWAPQAPDLHAAVLKALDTLG